MFKSSWMRWLDVFATHGLFRRGLKRVESGRRSAPESARRTPSGSESDEPAWSLRTRDLQWGHAARGPAAPKPGTSCGPPCSGHGHLAEAHWAPGPCGMCARWSQLSTGASLQTTVPPNIAALPRWRQQQCQSGRGGAGRDRHSRATCQRARFRTAHPSTRVLRALRPALHADGTWRHATRH